MRQKRIAAIRQHMKAHRLDAFIVTELAHVGYLSGFSGSSGACIVTDKRQFFLTDNRYKAQAPAEVQGFRIVIAPVSIFKTTAEKKLIASSSRIGFESHYLTVADLKSLQQFFPGCRLISTTMVVESISAVKDETEIDLLRTAVEITDKVFQKIIPIMKPGIAECDIAAEISYWHKRFGADADAFDPIVAAGPRGALPHARASMKKIKQGEMVVLDFGCRYKGYHSDLTRTLAVGKPSSAMKRIYTIVQDAQRLAIEAVKVGASGRSIDAIARAHIKRFGFGKFFIHSLGHGLGIHVHDPLRLSRLSKDIIQKGNVFTVEPGIYIPGKGGVRIEDDIVVYDNHYEILNTSPRDLLVL